ncbi:hypothetical protein Dda_2057 [Drechslerella dactyloides]|uniref:Uncharacterized protein n=1 Tax=Drechslerella dactyloides TaxID=74499 RepID=A0AAD6J302_DREDA|nr:hypothetical protein Dda_2057 [Drechslerella dactyloides]
MISLDTIPENPNAEGGNCTEDRVVVYLKLQAGRQTAVQPVELNYNWPLSTVLENITQSLREIKYVPPTAICDIHFNDTSARELVLLLHQTQQPQSSLLVRHVFFGSELLDVGTHTPNSSLNSNDVHGRVTFTTAMKLSWIHARNERLMHGDHNGEMSAVVFVGTDEFRMAVVKRYAYAGQVGYDQYRRKGCGKVMEMDGGRGRCVVRDASNGTVRVLRFRPRRGIWIEEV